MKMSFRLSHVLIIACLHYIHGQRRIKGGFDVKADKGYMVYLVETKAAVRSYNAWICGGCIVNRWFILTSAACVEDVPSIYVISGTRSYIPSSNISKNNCTKHTLRKVVFTCVPKEYILNFSKVEDWSFNDIAVIKVERPFDEHIELYEKYCDFKPNSISMNFDVKNEQMGTQVIVLGYGHTNFWRGANIKEDWNHLHMQYSSTTIHSLEKCKNEYNSPNLINNIEKHMICTNGSGIVNELGKPDDNIGLLRGANHEPNLKLQTTRKNNNFTFNLNTRRQGICQNDHGGPLVAWIEGQETVIGVASVFQIDEEQRCTGPYLYTSTARNQMFIECVVNEHVPRRRNLCDQPPSKIGFSISRRYILWKENEEHVEDNEEIRIRPQINMNFIRNG